MVTKATELNEHNFFITMAPPKQGELSQIARQPRVRTRKQMQSDGSEQQPSPWLEFVNVDKIPSPNTTLGSLTLMV
jgi:hypothetical protein